MVWLLHLSHLSGYCVVNLTVQNQLYSNVKLNLLRGLCTDINLGTDFQQQHESMTITYGVSKSPITFAALTCMKTEPPELFAHLTPDCHPIATKSRKYSQNDRNFIRDEVERLSQLKTVKPSNSPWRAQVLVVNGKKQRMVVDYSETINKYTQLDAYPLPKIDEMLNKIAHYKVFSTIDLHCAYYQIPLSEKDKIYTAFEADGKLWQFTCMPFSITNGSAVFQRKMDTLVVDHEFDDTFPFVDNITFCGRDKGKHDEKLKLFREAAEREILTLNEEKCVFRVNTTDLLDYRISHNSIKPDPDILALLLYLPVPEEPKSLKRMIGMFSYYAMWINNFSDKIHILNNVTKFPLNETQKNVFEDLKLELASTAMQPIDENIPFVVETDTSDFAISATLNQDGRPVAFHSCTLQAFKQHQAPVKKEAQAIVEAIHH